MSSNMNSLVPIDGQEEQGGAIVIQDESMTLEQELEVMIDQINVTVPISDQTEDPSLTPLPPMSREALGSGRATTTLEVAPPPPSLVNLVTPLITMPTPAKAAAPIAVQTSSVSPEPQGSVDVTPYGPASRATLRDSPVKASLKKDNAKLEIALAAERQKTLETEQEANNYIALNNELMAEKTQHALDGQRAGFEQAAIAFESTARSVVQQELNANDRDTRAVLENVMRSLSANEAAARAAYDHSQNELSLTSAQYATEAQEVQRLLVLGQRETDENQALKEEVLNLRSQIEHALGNEDRFSAEMSNAQERILFLENQLRDSVSQLEKEILQRNRDHEQHKDVMNNLKREYQLEMDRRIKEHIAKFEFKQTETNVSTSEQVQTVKLAAQRLLEAKAEKHEEKSST